MRSQLSEAFFAKLILLAVLSKAFFEFCNKPLIFFSMLSLIVVEGLGIGDDEASCSCSQILLHGFILCQAPFKEIGLHVLDQKDGNNFALHQ